MDSQPYILLSSTENSDEETRQRNCISPGDPPLWRTILQIEIFHLAVVLLGAYIWILSTQRSECLFADLIAC